MTNSKSENTGSKQPTHHAYHVLEREGKDAIWIRIGSAWTHGDGKGFNIQIQAAPLDGRISLRLPSDAKV